MRRHQLEYVRASLFLVRNSSPCSRWTYLRLRNGVHRVQRLCVEPFSSQSVFVSILYFLDYSQCTPGTGTSAPAPSPSSGLPRLGGVNTAGYDFSVVSTKYYVSATSSELCTRTS